MYQVDLPFDHKLDQQATTANQPCCCNFLSIPSSSTSNHHQYGKCCQGAGGLASHTKSLHWSYDFLLPIGTPILAALDGRIVAAIDSFKGGGTAAKYKARANYVVVQHQNGYYTRYYHLQPNSLIVQVGDVVQAGDVLGNSGSTGYTTGPHLHFDVVDLCIYSYVDVVLLSTFETSTTINETENKVPITTNTTTTTTTTTTATSTHTSKIVPIASNEQKLYSCVASFSGNIPSIDAPLCGILQWTDPIDATANPLSNAIHLKNKIAIIKRCGQLDFIEKAARAEDAGAVGVIIVNNEEGPALHVCATPKEDIRTIHIPVVMITMLDGSKLMNGNTLKIFKSSVFSFSTENNTAAAVLVSPLRNKWKEIGNEKEFSQYQPVTVGPVCFRVDLTKNDDDEEKESEGKKEKEENSIFLWENPCTNSNVKKLKS